MTTPERDPDSDARAWDDLVRRLRSDDDAAGSRPDEAEPRRAAPPPTEPAPAGPRDYEPAPHGPRDYEVAEPFDDDPEDDWQPEDPGPVTAGMRPGTLMAWAVLLGVSVCLLVTGFVLNGLPWWLWVPGLALILGSLVSLFQSLPEHRSDYDDGAQV